MADALGRASDRGPASPAAHPEKAEGRHIGRPETFNFLGFTHTCSTKRNGKVCVKRKTMRKRIRNRLKNIGESIHKRVNQRIADTGQWLGQVLRGHYQYYGVPHNYRSLNSMRWRIIGQWYRMLNRRGQKKGVTWDRMKQLAALWLPPPRIVHPYRSERLRVET